jgi:hypothetical protein
MQGRWRHFRWLTPGLYLTLLAAAPAGSGTSAPPPDLSGSWTLNEELSQDPRAMLREAMANGRAEPGGGRRGGRGGWGGRRGGGGGDESGGQRGERSAPDADEGGERRGGDFGQGWKELKIAASGPQLTLTSTDGASQQVLYTDGRKVSEEKAGVGTVKTQAQWKDGALEVVTQLPKGRKRTEIYEITHDRKRLYVLTTLEGYGRMPTVTFRRVYEPALPPAAAQPATTPPPGAGAEDDEEIVEDFDF